MLVRTKGRYSQTYQTANHGTHIEDAPEPGKVAALLSLSRVRDHNGALGSPEETSADTEKCTSNDVEGVDMVVNRDEQSDDVDTVSETTKRHGDLDTETVDKRSTKETKHGKGGVDGGVLITISMGEDRV